MPLKQCFLGEKKDEMGQKEYPQQPPETRQFEIEVGSSVPLPTSVCSLHGLTGRGVIA